MSDGYLEYIFKGLVGLVGIMLGWNIKKQVQLTEEIRKDLDSHKLYSAKNYIEKDVVDRIHTRIDSIDKKMDDVKDLLITTTSGKR